VVHRVGMEQPILPPLLTPIAQSAAAQLGVSG
jgi:hypothetical protein